MDDTGVARARLKSLAHNLTTVSNSLKDISESLEPPFSEGEIVMVRDGDSENWFPRVFGHMNGAYYVDSKSIVWTQCISLAEWKEKYY